MDLELTIGFAENEVFQNPQIFIGSIISTGYSDLYSVKVDIIGAKNEQKTSEGHTWIIVP